MAHNEKDALDIYKVSIVVCQYFADHTPPKTGATEVLAGGAAEGGDRGCCHRREGSSPRLGGKSGESGVEGAPGIFSQ